MSLHYHYTMTDSLAYVRDVAGGVQDSCNGTYVVEVPATIQVGPDITDLVMLTTIKASALADLYGYVSAFHDPCTTSTYIDAVPSSNVMVGSKHTTCMRATGSILYTQEISFGVPQTEVRVLVELFEYLDDNDKAAPYVRMYRDVDAGQVTVEGDFGDGVWYPIPIDAPYTIPVGPPADVVTLRFTSAASPDRRVWLGSWTVLF